MTTAHRDRRRANDLTCMTALGDVAAVLDRHRVDREADEIAFGAVVTTMRTLIASLVDLDPAVRAELAALVGELGDDASAVAAWTRFEDFVEHWFVLVRHVVFGLRPDAVPGELDRLRVDLRRALRTPTPAPPPPPPAAPAYVPTIAPPAIPAYAPALSPPPPRPAPAPAPMAARPSPYCPTCRVATLWHAKRGAWWCSTCKRTL